MKTFWLGLLLCAGLALSDSVPRGEACEKYDYIVVGGGTSGLVVANRLTENHRRMFFLP